MFSGGYHIIVIPKKAHQTRRLYLSSFTLQLLALSGLLIIPLVVGCFLSVIHYQNKMVALKREMSEQMQAVEQKEVLSSRLATIERSVVVTDQALEELARALDVEMGQVKQGVGPLEIEEGVGRDGDLSLPTVRGKISRLESRVEDLHSKIEHVTDLNLDKIRFMNSLPATLPVDGWVTSGFGFRRAPQTGAYRMHYGLDVASPVGTPILAPADGVVMMAEAKAGYGRKIVLDHGYGISTVYAHASKLFVSEGQTVRKGQKIAAVGSTGSSTGPHLHYEVHVDGMPTDPLNYVMK